MRVLRVVYRIGCFRFVIVRNVLTEVRITSPAVVIDLSDGMLVIFLVQFLIRFPS